jgi:hypothetical protein
MSSLERGMRIREDVFKSTGKRLGDGPGGWDQDVYGEEGMWRIGAVLEELIMDDWDEGDNWDAHRMFGTANGIMQE